MMAVHDNYTVRLLDMPCSVKAMTAMDEEGYCNIYVNSKLSREAQLKAIKHELVHIHKDDFHNTLDIREAESRAGA